jgi:hypothetical protein
MMSGEPNNGVQVGSIRYLVTPVERRRGIFLALALLLFLSDNTDSSDFLLTARDVNTGELLSSKRFRTRKDAERARERAANSAGAGHSDR